jgi:hypothetical protein
MYHNLLIITGKVAPVLIKYHAIKKYLALN